MPSSAAQNQQPLQKDMETTMSNLSLNAAGDTATKPAKKKGNKKAKEVVDDWEAADLSSASEKDENEKDDDDDDKEDTHRSEESPRQRPSSPRVPTPVSRTPASPGTQQPERRPEKTDAVARRMIAAGLGLKVPKQTEEQKEYQRSIREQERRRRDQERAEEKKRQEDAERAKAAIWDD